MGTSTEDRDSVMTTEEKLALAIGALRSIVTQNYTIPRDIAQGVLDRIVPKKQEG